MTKQETIKKWNTRRKEYSRMQESLNGMGKKAMAESLNAEQILVNEFLTDLKQLTKTKKQKTNGNTAHPNT